MTGLCRRAAAETIRALKLEEANRALAEHWLSLWQGDGLPSRAALNPANIKAFLPNILLFNVVPELRVTVRLAGTHFTYIFGGELTGADWIALADPARAAARLAMFSTIARGAVLVEHRDVAMVEDGPAVLEEILLPFAAGEDGVAMVMAHVNLSAAQYQKIAQVRNALSEPHDIQLVQLAQTGGDG
jgi:hypothetical protein